MTYRMASIIKKILRGHTYYYARECRRVHGQPKIVWQKYLGRADDIIAALGHRRAPADRPDQATITELGALAALYDLAQRLRLRELVDSHLPKRRGPHGPSTGTYVLLATLNRCTNPTSKARFADWFASTVLRRWFPLQREQLTSQRFWNHLNRLTPQAITAIERDLVAHLVPTFRLDVRQVLFDATNFFTFVDTFNGRCTLAQRGHSKEGRAALRIVGLALLVTADFHVPLCHHTYAGNQPDSPTFASLTEELVYRHKLLAEHVQDITLIFDKGNNSAANFKALDATPYHFIGALVPSQHPELLAIPQDQLRPLAGADLIGVRAYRTTKEVFGKHRTVVVTYNEKLFVAQSRTLLREIAKRQRLLGELQTRLQRWQRGEMKGGRSPTVAGVRKQVAGWLAARDLRDLFTVEVTEVNGLPVLTFHLREDAWQQLQTTRLGKTILFTDQEDWTDAAIVRGYRSQHHVEAAFRDLKNTKYLSLRPQWHWTDQKIQAHVFCCVLALMLCSLLRREVAQHGIHLALPRLLEELGRIREVAVVYPGKGKDQTPRVQVTLSELTAIQQALYKALDLGRHSAT
jgi:transposase